MLQKVPVGKALACATMAWGAAALPMGSAQNFYGLMALRFLMGCSEAPLFPCIAILNGMWYAREEQPSRTAVSFAVLSTVSLLPLHKESCSAHIGIIKIPTGLLSYGLGHTHGAIASWRLLFIVLGVLTIFGGIVLLIFLPDSP